MIEEVESEKEATDKFAIAPVAASTAGEEEEEGSGGEEGVAPTFSPYVRRKKPHREVFRRKQSKRGSEMGGEESEASMREKTSLEALTSVGKQLRSESNAVFEEKYNKRLEEYVSNITIPGFKNNSNAMKGLLGGPGASRRDESPVLPNINQKGRQDEQSWRTKSKALGPKISLEARNVANDSQNGRRSLDRRTESRHYEVSEDVVHKFYTPAKRSKKL